MASQAEGIAPLLRRYVDLAKLLGQSPVTLVDFLPLPFKLVAFNDFRQETSGQTGE